MRDKKPIGLLSRHARGYPQGSGGTCIWRGIRGVGISAAPSLSAAGEALCARMVLGSQRIREELEPASPHTICGAVEATNAGVSGTCDSGRPVWTQPWTQATLRGRRSASRSRSAPAVDGPGEPPGMASDRPTSLLTSARVKCSRGVWRFPLERRTSETFLGADFCFAHSLTGRPAAGRAESATGPAFVFWSAGYLATRFSNAHGRSRPSQGRGCAPRRRGLFVW